MCHLTLVFSGAFDSSCEWLGTIGLAYASTILKSKSAVGAPKTNSQRLMSRYVNAVTIHIVGHLGPTLEHLYCLERTAFFLLYVSYSAP